jgi:RNA polymerase sigma factor (sigma-70 family)
VSVKLLGRKVPRVWRRVAGACGAVRCAPGGVPNTVRGSVHSRRLRGYHLRIAATKQDFPRVLLENLALLEQVVRSVARRHRVPPDDVEELIGAVQLKLVERDYQALRRFEGRATLATYLAAIATRHLLDERNAKWGKWRPSVYARRLGPAVMQLELLMTRDGVSFREAVERVRTSMPVAESDHDLARIARGFPQRSRRRFVAVDVLAELPAPQRADDGVEEVRRGELWAKVHAALRAALTQLPSDDQLVLRLCFEENLSLAAVSRALGLPQKPLYKRYMRVLAVLRAELERLGVHASEVRDIIGVTPEPDDAAGENP